MGVFYSEAELARMPVTTLRTLLTKNYTYAGEPGRKRDLRGELDLRCRHCGLRYLSHAPDTKCLFEPTYFEHLNEKET